MKFEASVAGGIPIVNAINNGLNANNISKFMGILNGTSNFILSKMTREQTTFEDALWWSAKARFCQADPTDDVEGIDAARKVVITSYLSFNQVIKLNDVKVRGISQTTLSDINVADKLGYKIKLIGKGTYQNSKVNASVEPTLIHKSHQLATVEDEYNAIYVVGDAVGDTMFYGKGAGSLATGSAVVSDLLNVALFFESNTHTLPPHFELKTDATREIMDTEDVVAIQEKLNYYIVLNSDLSKEKFKSLLKETLPFHKSLQVEQRDEQTYGVVIIGLDQSPEDVLSKADFNIEKIYPVEGV